MSKLRTLMVCWLVVGPLSGTYMAVGAEPEPASSVRKVVQRWNLGGSGGWDYLTLDSAQRLFISRSTRVDVMNTQSGKIIGSIAGTQGVHGIALAENINRGYTSNGKADSVTVFELDSLKTIREVPVSGHNPDAIVFDPPTQRLFTFNGRSKDVTVFDSTSMSVIATLPVPDKPEFAVSDGEGRIFVNIESEHGQMVVIDSRKMTIAATWPLPGCASPSGLAIDKAHHRLFSVCDEKVMAITDAITGKQVSKITIGESPDAAAFDAQRGLVYSSNGEGTLTVVRQESADRYQVAASVETKRGARTMALDPSSGRIYLVTADFGAAPPATAEQPHPRPAQLPDTFTVLVVGVPSRSENQR
jgi:DNA-binding beta-propeller fold protein YncE